MTVAAYNRGTKLVARQFDEITKTAVLRAEFQHDREQTEALRARVAELERELSRARRCLAAERLGRESLRVRLQDSERAYAFAVACLCGRK